MSESNSTAIAVPTSGGTSLVESSQTILEVLKPFSPMDGHKGTYLMLLLAGIAPSAAQKMVKRKYRTILEWRIKDPTFRQIESRTEFMAPHFSNQARVLRAAMLDASVVEAANMVITKYLCSEQLTDGEWQLLAKVVQLRMPQLTIGSGTTEDSWSKIAALLKPLVVTKEVSVQQSRELVGDTTTEQTTVTMKQSGVDMGAIERAIGGGELDAQSLANHTPQPILVKQSPPLDLHRVGGLKGAALGQAIVDEVMRVNGMRNARNPDGTEYKCASGSGGTGNGDNGNGNGANHNNTNIIEGEMTIVEAPA